MKQKGLATIVIVVLISAALFIGYLIYRNAGCNFYHGCVSVDESGVSPTLFPKQTLQPSPTPSSNPESSSSAETASWQPLESEIFSIAFKFPKGWNPAQQLIYPKEENVKLLIEFTPSGEKYKSRDTIKLFYVYNPNKLSLEKLNRKLTGNSGENPGLASSDDVKVTNPNGIEAYYSKQHYCVSKCQSYTWVHNNQVFQLINYPQQDLPNQTEVFEGIFSSFKFTQ